MNILELLFRLKTGLDRKGFHAAAQTPDGVIPLSLYPDFNRRPRNHTGSADLAAEQASARGLSALRKITAGGESHPALRTFWSLARPALFTTNGTATHR